MTFLKAKLRPCRHPTFWANRHQPVKIVCITLKYPSKSNLTDYEKTEHSSNIRKAEENLQNQAAENHEFPEDENYVDPEYESSTKSKNREIEFQPHEPEIAEENIPSPESSDSGNRDSSKKSTPEREKLKGGFEINRKTTGKISYIKWSAKQEFYWQFIYREIFLSG